MKTPRHLPDLFIAVAAVIIGGLLAAYLHTKWYYGGWMSMFGDPPDANPAYDRFVPLFVSMPYVVAGAVAGLVAGFGRPSIRGILIRSLALPPLFLILLFNVYHGRNVVWLNFVPVAACSFLISTTLSLTYFWLLLRTPAEVATNDL